MFNKLLQDIRFEDIEAFCTDWPEGVRVEYKSTIQSGTVPKIVSSFSNTLGGIWLIGVRTNSATNLPTLPIEGFPKTPGVEDQIIQACHDGIYPPITPATRLIELPGNPANCVVIVKIPESLEAPHAIQNKTQVYIRVAGVTPPYELSEIDRIKYFLSRRDKPEQMREELIQKCFSISPVGFPRLRIVIGPRYPYSHLLSGDKLEERVERISSHAQWGMLLPRRRRVQEGFMSSDERHQFYFRANMHGFICYDELLRVGKTRDGQMEYFLLAQLVKRIAHCLKAAQILLDDTTTNLILRVRLESINCAVLHDDTFSFTHEWLEAHRPVEPHASAETDMVRETLEREFANHVFEVVRQLMWAFDWADDSVGERVRQILQANRLI